MFEINKGGTIQIGDYYNSHPETQLFMGGKELCINSESNDIQMKVCGIPFSFNCNEIQMNLVNGIINTIIEHGYELHFDENKDFLIKRPQKYNNEFINRLFFWCGLNFRNVLDNLKISKSGSNTPTPLEKITIPYGTEILTTFNSDWNTYLPVVPNTLCVLIPIQPHLTKQ
jgi:hypothetical protein